MEINVLEMFNSISGEVTPYHQGCPTTFLRLGNCNLNCSYCDTPNAHETGTTFDFKKLVNILFEYYQSTGRLCITGGEPLLQRGQVKNLLNYFSQSWIETNGTIDFAEFIHVTNIVADFKLDHMTEIPYYFYRLPNKDFIKFVIGSNEDFEKAMDVQKTLQIGGCEATFAYSPMHNNIEVDDLLKLVLKGKLPNTIINIQIHKYLGMK